jgi:acyl transferase domain-containing protein
MQTSLYIVICVIFCLEHHKLPKRAGKVPSVTKFDASFFGVNYKQAHTMDPLCRLLLERTYEAIVDAGQQFYMSSFV